MKYCIGVGNGLDALMLILRALDIGVGDEVIVPSNTYIATVLAVSYVGATPVFKEPDVFDTHSINPDLIRLSLQKMIDHLKRKSVFAEFIGVNI